MAEILISLTIIGIIAAITLPALQANINEKTWATKRKALYSRMSQAIGMMDSLNGYGVVFEDGSINETQTANKATQAFITDGLSKVLKISNVCDGSTTEGLKKCGFPDKFTKQGKGAPKMDTPKTITDLNVYFNGNYTNVRYYQIVTNNAAFETVNGESILVSYNPNCSYTYGLNLKNDKQNLMQPMMCANFIYDLNGRKGPNQVGKDIGFITAFYPTDSVVVAPDPVGAKTARSEGEHQQFSISYGNLRCHKSYGTYAKMANIEELMSLFVNRNLGYMSLSVPYFITTDFVVSSTVKDGKYYGLWGNMGSVFKYDISVYHSGTSGDYNYLYCVKK